VSVKIFDGLMVEFAEAEGAVAVIRGLRAFSDFEFEFNMALMNRHLKASIEAVFVMPNENFSYTSSSLVKQVARHGGDIGKFVPPNVAEALRAVYGQG
jgi:pantetheine-phosphate adenylyltransferase